MACLLAYMKSGFDWKSEFKNIHEDAKHQDLGDVRWSNHYVKSQRPKSNLILHTCTVGYS